MSLDPRLTLARADLAAADLEGMVRAVRFAAPTLCQAASPAAAIRAQPVRSAEQVDQLLCGELFEVLDETGEFAWGQARRDGYVGFVDKAALTREVAIPTHWVKAVRTFAFVEASIKTPARGPLSLNSLVAVSEETENLAHASSLGWIPRRHLAPIGECLGDPAAVAETFLGAPYLWGGRESVGLDCSGLIQQALLACGMAAPRDADLQAGLGEATSREDARRGDLVCWRGHIGMMLDHDRLIHANAHHMAVAIEPVDGAIARIDAKGAGAPIAWRRLAAYASAD